MSRKLPKPRPRRSPSKGRLGPVQAVWRGSQGSTARVDAASTEDRLVDAFSIVVRWSRRELHDKTLKEAGLDLEQSAAVILGTLYHHEPVRVSDLAGQLELDRSTVSRQVAEVVEQGLVARMGDTTDARASMLSLTPQGHAMRRKLAAAFKKICMDLVSDWSLEDQLTFVRLLDKLADRLRGEGVF